jgi:uncharacterized protein (TIGR02145 family)
VKAIIYYFKRTNWFKALVAFLTCLLFLILPSCQKDELNQDSIADISPLASSNKVKTTGKIKDVDGNWYKTVKIGDQWWMAENLKTTKYNDGSDITLVEKDEEWYRNTPAYCWYNNDEKTYKKTYGALYNWYAVNMGNLCPTDWHVPTHADWTTLITFLGGQSVAGGNLKETGTTHWQSPNIGATDQAGFTALPAGTRGMYGYFAMIGVGSYWWSASEGSLTIFAWYCAVLNEYSTIWNQDGNKENGLSIRCLKD